MEVIRDPVCHRVRNSSQQNTRYSGTPLYTDEYQWTFFFVVLHFFNGFMKEGSFVTARSGETAGRDSSAGSVGLTGQDGQDGRDVDW